MSYSGRLLFLLLILSAASAANAQPSTKLEPPDPFLISNGTSFSASGSDPTRPAYLNKPSRIAAELREAQQLIATQHITGTRQPDLVKNALDGMLKALDPHSNFYDATEWRELMDEQDSGYTGIGATIGSFSRGGSRDTYVLSTFAGSPAARAGLKFGDRIVAINGEKMSERDPDDVRDRIRGANGSAFQLTIERSASGRVETIDIRRGRVSQPSIPDSYILRPGVGYIALTEGFNYTTAEEFDRAMRELKRAGMTSLVLDLRGNGGGLVDQAVKVAERFLPAGTLILTQRGRSRIDNRTWRSSNMAPEQMPVVVLVDEDTASASEIVAGAFQDHDRALIVGEKTFGKGLVQSVIDLPGRTGLALTTARYLTPSGRSIQRDYTQITRYDYYNHKTPTAEIGKAFFEARTITDRRVVGGDGILPDESISTEDLTPEQIALLDPVFFFVRDLVNGKVSGFAPIPLSSAATRRILPGGLSVTPNIISAFNDFAARPINGSVSQQALRSNEAFLKVRLRYDLAIATHGAVTADQVLVEDDPQVAKAVETIPNSARLAQSAAMARKKK